MPNGAAISREEKKVENKEVRILVVDDEPTMADSLRQNFVEEGYSVDTAATGAAAIELFDQGGHHLSICDLQLPDMQVFTLPFIAAQLVRAREVPLNHHFELSRHRS